MTTKVAYGRKGEGTAMSNGTALSPGQRAEFLKAGIGALTLLSHDPNLDPTTADGWAKNGKILLRKLRLMMIPAADPDRGVMGASVVVVGGGRTTDQIVAAARGRGIYVDNDINQSSVPSGHGGRRSVVVEFFGFGSHYQATTEEVCARCEEPGCGYPTYEDGLRFQEDHHDKSWWENGRVFVPENPWYKRGEPQALAVWWWDGVEDPVEAYAGYFRSGDRQVDLGNCHARRRWPVGSIFARRRY